MSPSARTRLIAIVGGFFLLLAGGLIFGIPLIQRAQAVVRTNNWGASQSAAVSEWNSGANNALTGAANGNGPTARALSTCRPSSSNTTTSYAEVAFTATNLAQYNYVGVAGDGTWSLLDTWPMVHYKTTPAPGQQGNVIIAFHREPDYQYINGLAPGGTVTIQDRQCNVYVYTVTNVWDENPNNVTQLVPTTGYNLTLITCTPFWQDYNRLVWRATLTSVNGKPFTPPTS